MIKETYYEHLGHSYPLIITYKRIRYIHFRYRDGSFFVSCPYRAPLKIIRDGLDKYYSRLVKENPREKAIGDDYIYVFGNRYEISGRPLNINGDVIEYKNKDELLKKLSKCLLKYITKMTREKEILMNESTHNVRVKNMASRYGSNSLRTHSISYSLILLHYHPSIIEAVVIHELAHDYVRGHGKDFYCLVYKYCPNYKTLHQHLRKGEFSL